MRTTAFSISLLYLFLLLSLLDLEDQEFPAALAAQHLPSPPWDL